MSNNITQSELKSIMNDIEIKTQNTIITGIKTGKLVDPTNLIMNNFSLNKKELNESENLLVKIMKSSNEEFEKKVGRPITYSEMRSMYG